jgi:hypothetical protein
MVAERSECNHAALTRITTPMLISKIEIAAPLCRAPKDVAFSPATTPNPTNTDIAKLPITYALSSLTGRGRLRITNTNTTAIAVGLAIADNTASGISWKDTIR